MLSDCFRLYEEFFGIVSGFRDYSINPSVKQIKFLNKFLEGLEKEIFKESLGINWLFDYVSFAFSIRHSQNTKVGKGIIPLNWIFGEAQLKRFNERSEVEVFYQRQFLQKYSIVNPVEKVRVDIKSLEDFERERFLNKPEGFSHCIGLTSLYQDRNKICLICQSKKNCKTLLNLS